SETRTSQSGSPSRRRTTAAPMVPAPPVTRTRFMRRLRLAWPAKAAALHSARMQIRGRLKRRRRFDEPAWFEERVRQIARDDRVHRHAVFGDERRLRIHASAQVHNAMFNTVSGTIEIRAHAFFGHGVSVLTGTHDIAKEG